jgi:amino acid adenylation domain-containing protein
VLLLTLHHIASDGWSNGIVLSELSRHYAALLQPSPAETEELPALQYIDYSIWQHERHQQAGFVGSLGYWQAQLAGLPALHSLPTDRMRPARQSFAGAHLESAIPNGTLAGLRNLCRDSGATLFMVLSAAWSIVQARFSAVDDVVVGTPVAGRESVGLERTVGCFINNVVLRFDVSGSPSFVEYLAQVRQTALDAYSHAELPFEMLVEDLNPVRTSSHTPLFQVLLALQSYEESPLSLEGTRCESRMQGYPYSKFDISLYCRERTDGVDVLWEYATALFDEATVQRMSRAFAVVLEAIAMDPSTALDRLPLVDPPEQQLLMAMARGPVVQRAEEPVHVWFEARCEQAPQRRALVAEDAVLSYGELNAQANRIAHMLSERVVKPAPVIGVCLDRNSSLVAALLGVLKSGACYVPLDSTQPAARLHAMAAQAQVDAIVTDEKHAGLFAALEEFTAILPLDSATVSGELAAASSSNPDRASLADNRAYIIFTSGSTGVPKGVTIGHAALGNLLLSMAEAPGMSEQDRLLAVTSIGFDIAGLEIFLPLVSGAELHLADAATCRDVVRLAASLEHQGITVMQATPSLWQLLADSGALGGVATGLKILVGGEALTDALASRLCEIGSSVWNLYGPTETTIWSTRWQCSAGQAVSIGAPVENTECYVLSPALQLQPRGAVGELYIGGDGLAMGYHGRPELTAEVFIPHPFNPQGRLYRTGDLCRQAEDGRLFCLGRRDHQIKIRGFRVEPGEVEAALLQCDGIAGSVVTMGRNSAGDRCLLAHVTATDAMLAPPAADPVSMDTSGQAVIAQLSSLLPDYMIPSAVVFIPRMPLNANGKIDRLALPVIAIGAEPQEREAPATEMEGQLASMWAEGLQVMHVGVTDNFFSLGGHSILAMKLLARINAEYGLSVPLFDFIEAPTIRALAAKMGSLADLRRAQALVAEMGGAVEWGHEIIL